MIEGMVQGLVLTGRALNMDRFFNTLHTMIPMRREKTSLGVRTKSANYDWEEDTFSVIVIIFFIFPQNLLIPRLSWEITILIIPVHGLLDRKRNVMISCTTGCQKSQELLLR